MISKNIPTKDLINELNRRSRELTEEGLKQYSLYIEIEKTPYFFVANLFKKKHMYSGEIVEGNILISKAGYGKTIEEAKEDLLRKIRGKTIMFSGYSKNREEVLIV